MDEREQPKPGSLNHAKVIRPGEIFVVRSRGQGAMGLCLAVEEWVDLSAFPHRPRRRILVLWSNPETLLWIVLP